MRARIKKIIIDYQTNKKQTIGLKIHYRVQGIYEVYKLSTGLIERFLCNLTNTFYER